MTSPLRVAATRFAIFLSMNSIHLVGREARVRGFPSVHGAGGEAHPSTNFWRLFPPIFFRFIRIRSSSRRARVRVRVGDGVAPRG